MGRTPGPTRPAGAVAAVVATAVFAGCSTAPPENTALGPRSLRPNTPHTVALRPIAVDPRPALPVQVQSADGRRVSVARVDRIIPLAGNLAEMVFSLGLGAKVVARDISATFREARRLPLVTRAHDVSAESLLSLRPDLVLAQTDTGPPEALDQIRSSGIPVVVSEKPSSVAEIGARAELVGKALGVPDEGRKLARRIEHEILDVRKSIPSRTNAPRVAFLYMRGQAGVYLLGGKGSGPDSMIEAAGGDDAGTEIGLTRSFTPITSEALVQARPDAILMTTTGLESVGGVDGLLKIPGIAETPAGRDRRIVTLEDGLLFSFGARTPQALASLIAKLHPATPHTDQAA